jgi:hypothetical protein
MPDVKARIIQVVSYSYPNYQFNTVILGHLDLVFLLIQAEVNIQLTSCELS